MTPLTHDAIAARVRSAFPSVEPFRSVETRTSENGQPWLLVPTAEIERVARFLRDEQDLAFASLMDLTGYDLLKYPATPPSDQIAVVYLLHSLVHRHKVTLKVLVPRVDSKAPTVSRVWPVATYFEREVWDLLGVTFTGHPSLERIMTPEDWVGHPLRKDYVYPAQYHGVPHLREGQHFENAPMREGQPVREGQPASAAATKPAHAPAPAAAVAAKPAPDKPAPAQPASDSPAPGKPAKEGPK